MEIRKLNAQFYVGGAGSGAPMHFHPTALNYLAWGTKEWLLLPRTVTKYSTIPALEYFERSFLKSGPVPEGTQVCTQNAGEIFIVPDDIGHVRLSKLSCLMMLFAQLLTECYVELGNSQYGDDSGCCL